MGPLRASVSAANMACMAEEALTETADGWLLPLQGATVTR
jgi:hypothetical protein